MSKGRIRKKIHHTSKTVYNLKGFRYLISGGSATVVDVVAYFFLYNFLLKKEMLDFYYFHVSPHIASFIISFSLGMITNFIVTKYFVFSHQTNMRKREELLRFVMVSLIVFLANYFLLKIFVEAIGIYPTPSRILASGIVAISSFNLHKYFTFKVKVDKELEN